MSWMGIAESSPIGPLHIAALVEETGPPILFLHGVTRTWRDWTGVTATLSHRWRPYCLDFRGHGESARAPGQYYVKQFVDDAVHVARQTINQPFIVVGHSLGAMVACGVAERLKDMVIGAVLEDPPFGTMGSRIGTLPFLNQFQGIQDIMRQERWHDLKDLARTLGDLTIRDPNSERTFRLGDVRDAATLRFNAACLIKMDPEVLTPVIEGDWLRGFPWERIVTGIDCPTLLLQADVTTGGMLFDDDVTTMMHSVRDLTVIRFPKTVHQIHTTALEAYLRVVIPFLESLTFENPI